MSMMTIEIEEVSCTGCGACIRECGHGGPRALRDRAPEKCKRCFHCFAVCPSGAIAVRGRTDRDVESAPVPPVGIKALTAFLASRRSTRHFLPAAVPETVLARLFEAAAYIPSGGNRRSHRFTLLRPFVDPPTRAFLGDPEYGERIREIISRLDAGEDPVFYAAPIVIVIHSRELIPTPREDSVLAGYALCLAAHALGLGSCLVSLAQSAVNSSGTCKRLIGLTRHDNVHAVILVGYPDVSFLRAAPRESVPVAEARP